MSLCSDHTGHLCSLLSTPANEREGLQPAGPYIHWFKHQSTSPTSSEI